jgi:hypothetical protein
MPNIDDDESVANLLKQDAKSATKKYELVGIDAFNPKRCVTSTYVTAIAHFVEVRSAVSRCLSPSTYHRQIKIQGP